MPQVTSPQMSTERDTAAEELDTVQPVRYLSESFCGDHIAMDVRIGGLEMRTTLAAALAAVLTVSVPSAQSNMAQAEKFTASEESKRVPRPSLAT